MTRNPSIISNLAPFVISTNGPTKTFSPNSHSYKFAGSITVQFLPNFTFRLNFFLNSLNFYFNVNKNNLVYIFIIVYVFLKKSLNIKFINKIFIFHIYICSLTNFFRSDTFFESWIGF